MIFEALSRIIRHKVRALLMVLTFVLGLASVISIVGTIEGGRKAQGSSRGGDTKESSS